MCANDSPPAGTAVGSASERGIGRDEHGVESLREGHVRRLEKDDRLAPSWEIRGSGRCG
jgi:hypothetical protein